MLKKKLFFFTKIKKVLILTLASFTLPLPSYLEEVIIATPPKILLSTSCSTSFCHGGSSNTHAEAYVWYNSDPHQKGLTSLLSSWGKQISLSLKIETPSNDSRCTSCHSPINSVYIFDSNSTKEGVNCIACHGNPSNWFYSHTRDDYSYEDSVQLGMLDLKDPYVLSNTCVACHNYIDPELTNAGHPPLIFDINYKLNKLTPHWKEKHSTPKEKLWIIGKLTALRELKWHQEQYPNSKEINSQYKTLTFLIQHTLLNTPFTFYNIEITPLLEKIKNNTWSPSLTSLLINNILSIKNWGLLNKDESYLCAQQITLALHTFITDPKESYKIEKLQTLTKTPEAFVPSLFLETLSIELSTFN